MEKKKQKQHGNTVQTRLQLVEKIALNHDSYLFKFKSLDKEIPLTIGKHIVFKEFIKTYEVPEGEQIDRKYTPLSPHLNKEGLLQILIKIYRENANPKFPLGGKLTPYLESLNAGAIVHAEGPRGKFNYTRGVVQLEGEAPFPVKKFAMISGGSGVTPIFNVASQIVKDKDDHVEIIMLCAHKTEQDILLRKELQAMTPRIKLNFMIDKHFQGWPGLAGHVCREVLEKLSGLEEEGTFYCFSGPFLMNQAIRTIFQSFPKAKVFKF